MSDWERSKVVAEAHSGRRGVLRLGALIAAVTAASATSACAASTADRMDAQPDGYVPLSQKGEASGVATLDGAAKLPATQMPDVLTGKKIFDASGKLEFNGGQFTPNYDTLMWIAGAPRVDPTLSSQGLYIQHRVAGNLHGLVNDAGASELRMDGVTNTGAGQSAHENSLVVTGGTNTIGKLSGCLSNFHAAGTATGNVQDIALFRATRIPPLPAGFTVDTAAGLCVESQTVGKKNYSILAPDGDSVLGPIVAKDTGTASLQAQSLEGQTAPIFQVLDAKPSSTTLFRLDPGGTGGIGGLLSGVTFFVNNDQASAGTAAMAVRGATGQAADLQQWQDSGGSTLAKVTASGAIKASVVDTSSRPSASTAGVGAQVYDATLKKPIWSDGTIWRDAMGEAV